MAVVILAAASAGKALWYLTRGTGLVSMILLSGSVVLGVAESRRWATTNWPRFIIAALHKNVSLIATAFVVVHVATSVLDAYAPIRWLDAVIPFLSPYRPLWLGLGALASDLLLAVLITSLLRNRIGYSVWRAVHWAAYACWPIAVVHGLGTGTDSARGWALAVYAVCIAAVVVSVWWRLAMDWDSRSAPPRIVAVVGSVTAPALMVVLVAVGPLRPGWAARAGTPVSLIGGRQVVTSGSSSATTPVSAAPSFAAPFDDQLAGTLRQRTSDDAQQATVTIEATLTGQVDGTLAMTLVGTPAQGGGIVLSSSSASMGPAADPTMYQGRVTALDGSQLTLQLSDAAGDVIRATLDLEIDPSGNVSGTLQTS